MTEKSCQPEKTSATTRNRSFREQTTCQVCTDSAIYSNFGAIVCSSCKMFFKRNARKKLEDLRCHFDGQCQINVKTRNACAACRLAKCFEQGMQSELLRGKNTTPIKRTKTKKTTMINGEKILEVEVIRPIQFPTLNLLEHDRSTLTVQQWNDLSNISHCYDEYHSLCLAEQTINEQNKLPLKRRFKSTTIADIMQIFASNVERLYTKNGDFLSLSPSNRSILIRRTMLAVASLSCCFLANTSQLLSNSAFYQTMESIYGSTSSHYGQLTAERLDRDIVFVKLIMALMIFSTFDFVNDSQRSNPSCSFDVKSITKIQDRYTELTWRYLIHRYDYQRAVQCFSNLIRSIFTLHLSLASVETAQYYQMIDHLVQKTETSLRL